jgi:N-acyl-D-amino-acid deacylase
VRLFAASAALIAIGSVVAAGHQAGYDILIAGAHIIDGTGQPARDGDIAIRAGRIVAVGRIAAAPAEQRIDAAGLAVSPGFVANHPNTDDVTRRVTAEAFVRAGITTVVDGTEGVSPANVADVLDGIRRTGAPVNYATFVGHGTVRLAVMGNTSRDPLLAELNQMKSVVFEAIADGAIGFSTGLQTPPGRYARNSELVAIARVAANERGVYAAQVRADGVSLELAVVESIRMAESLAMPVQLSGLVLDPAQPATTTAVLKAIDDARRRSVDAWVNLDPFAGVAGVNMERDRLLQHPMAAIGSEGLRVLAEDARDRRVISMEDAIRKMTSLPAARLGFAGRGVIQTDAPADLVIFDPQPTPVAVRDVIVNGVVVLRDGQLTGARPGKVLRRTAPKG